KAATAGGAQGRRMGGRLAQPVGGRLSRMPHPASVAGMGNGGADSKDDPQGRGTRRTFAPWTDPTARALVRFDGVSKQFAAVAAVERVSLDIFAGEFFALLGPS